MSTRAFLVLLCFCFLLGAQPALQVPEAAQPGPGFNPETATRAYLDTFKPSEKTRSDSYFEGGYWLILWDFLFASILSLLLLETHVSARMREWAERWTGNKPLAIWLYWAQYLLLTFVLGAPLSVYEGFFRERQYGLMNQTFAAWLVDQLKSLGLGLVLGGLLVMALFLSLIHISEPTRPY